MKKAGILLSILLFSLLTVFLTITPPVLAQEQTDPQEINSGVGRPYQDLTGVDALSDGTYLMVNVSLAGAPPKEDNETHVSIYIAFDTDNKTNSGSDHIQDAHGIDAGVAPFKRSGEGPGGGHYYPEYCLGIQRWTGLVPQKFDLFDKAHSSIDKTGVEVDNTTDGKTVMTKIPLARIGNPTNVTIYVVTAERAEAVPSSADQAPPTDFAHIFRDTIGNATFWLPWNNWGQLLLVYPAIIGLNCTEGPGRTLMRQSETDDIGDFVVLPFNDITEVKVGQKSLVINITLANTTNLNNWWNLRTRWRLAIAIDTDGLPNSGQSWLWKPGSAPDFYKGIGITDVQIDPAYNNTYWEKLVLIDQPVYTAQVPNYIKLYDKDFNERSLGGITTTFNVTENKVIVDIPVNAIVEKPSRLNLTIISGQDWYYQFQDVVGTWTYEYNATINTQGYYLIRTTIPTTEEIYPIFPGDKLPTPPSVIGRPYQDIRGAWAKSDGTNLNVSVTLDQGPPKRDNETHVNIYAAIDNGTTGGSWRLPDEIDAGYVTNTYFWEYCLALYNWTTPGAQSLKLLRINEYVDPPRTPSWSEISTTGISVTNSSTGTIVNITIPLAAIGSPSTVTIGVVTSEDLAKVKDTVGSGYVRTSLSQWVEITPAIIGLSTTAGSSAPASDPAGDFVGKSFWDITGVTVGVDNYVINVNVTFQNVTTITWSMDQWRLAIGIDINHTADIGRYWMNTTIGLNDIRIATAINTAYWERCVVLDNETASGIHLYDEDLFDWGSSGITAELLEAENKVSVKIPSWILPPCPDQRLNLTVVSGMDVGTVYDVYGTWSYAYDATTQGFYLLTTAIMTGPVMYPFPLPGVAFNDGMGRPYQDIREVWANADGTNLNVSVTLDGAPPKEDGESHVDIYVALDTKAGGQDWFPDEIDARYNLSEPEHFWEYCLKVWSWTGTQNIKLVNKTWGERDALALGVTVTNSTDGTIINITIPLVLIGSPSTVTIGVVTSEDWAKVKDTVGNGTAILVGAQWIQVEPAITDLSTTSSSKSASDPKPKDFVGKSFWDITDVNVNVNYTDIVVDVTFLNVSGLRMGWDNREWWLAIQIDTDHLLGSGEPWTWAPHYGTDTRFVNESVSEWELSAIVNKENDIIFCDVIGGGWNIIPHGVRASLIDAQNKIRVAIPKSWLKLHTWDYNLTLTVISGFNREKEPTASMVYDIYGTYEYGYVGQYGVTDYPAKGFYIAHTDPSLNYTGPFYANFSLVNIISADIDMDYWFDADPLTVVVAFYDYSETYQANTTLPWTITPPERFKNTTKVEHPDGKPIEIMKILLVEDGGKVSVIEKLVVSRSDLFKRSTEIDSAWPAASVAQRQAYMKELALIDLQWHYAPPTRP